MEGTITTVGIEWVQCTLARQYVYGSESLFPGIWEMYDDPKGQGLWWFCENLGRAILPGFGGPADNINFQISTCEVRVHVNGATGRHEYIVHVALSASLHVSDEHTD